MVVKRTRMSIVEKVMLHKNRVFRVVNRASHGNLITTPNELAHILYDHTWCLCSGFQIDHLVFLNDSTSPDGAQEYAVFDIFAKKQIESLTVSWYDNVYKLEKEISSLLKSNEHHILHRDMPSLNHPEGSCMHCA